MKYLRLLDHNGNVTLIEPVYVEGPDFEYTFPQPVALWFGKIELLDKLPLTYEEGMQIAIQETTILDKFKKEVEIELETVSDKGSGDSGVVTPSQPESIEMEVESRNGGEVTKGDKRDRKFKRS